MKLLDRFEKQTVERATDLLSDAAMHAADWLIAKWPVDAKRDQALAPARIIAHRGAWKERGCIENTFTAFDRARESGAWGLEFDVRFTKDDVPIVHHDPTLKRTFGRALTLEAMTFRTLRHEAPVIPTLDEVLGEYAGSMHLMIELKGERNDWTDARFQKVMDLTSKLKASEDFHFMAIDVELLDALERRAGVNKQTLISIATGNPAGVSKLTLERGYRGFTSHWLLLTDAYYQAHRQAQQAVGVGFAASPASLRREWARGIDWIFTNHAHLAPTWLSELK